MKYLLFVLLAASSACAFSQTSFIKTDEKLANGLNVYSVSSAGQVIGQFCPIHTFKLVTRQTEAAMFIQDLATVCSLSGASVVTPGSMTTSAGSGYVMEGKSLSNGRPCGDGDVYTYGILIFDKGVISFTHKSEVGNLDSLYNKVESDKGTLMYLPSVYRNGAFLNSEKTLDKVLVKRETPDGEQTGIIFFDKLTTYNDARRIILGLDRPGQSKTTHIYMLDGGPTWGQACKHVNGKDVLIGTRNPDVVTNYVLWY